MSQLESAIEEANGCSGMLSVAGIEEGAQCSDVATDNAIVKAIVSAIAGATFDGQIGC